MDTLRLRTLCPAQPSGRPRGTSFHATPGIQLVKCSSDFREPLWQIHHAAQGTWEPLIYSQVGRSKGHDLDWQLAFQAQAVCGTCSGWPVSPKQV